MSDSNATTLKLFQAFAGLLLAVGTLMVCSASMTSLSLHADRNDIAKHLAFLAISVTCGAVCAQIPVRWWRHLAPACYIGTVVLLTLVLIPGVGHRVNGAQRWLRFSGFSFQPSEIAKLTVPLMVCWFRFDQQGRLRPGTLREMLLVALMLLPLLVLTLLEPDLGATLFLVVLAGLTLFLSRISLWYFFVAAFLAVPAFAGLIALKPYQLARVQGFINTWTHPELAPYQIRQSLTTLGTGGIHGTGLGRGWQKLSFLPEANTDFIFAVIGEELGLVGTLGVIGLWMGTFSCGMKVVRRMPSTSFEAIVATVLLTGLALQAALNVAVVTAMVPPKGISHPLISYGGSSLLASVISLGVFISLTRMPEPSHSTEFPLEVEDDNRTSESGIV